jgi:predicted ATPase
MPSIHIKSIGPISDSGLLEFTPVVLLIGKQSTGKSTLMKILCFCSWIEKKIMVEGEELLSKYTHYNRFVKDLKAFHRLDNIFFSDKSEIHYEGDCIKIDFKGVKANAKIVRKPNFQNDRHNTKISFIPSERNIVSAIKNVSKAYKTSDYDVIYNYLWEFDEAKTGLLTDKLIEMPFDNNITYYYDTKKERDLLYLKDLDKSIDTMYASSGVQSAMPIMVITKYITSIVGTGRPLSQKDITNAIAKVVLNSDLQDDKITEVYLSKVRQLLFYKNCKLFIEELEQNLFPQSQYDMVKAIVKGIKAVGNNSSVVMTTHSPYVLTSLNLLMKAAKAFKVDAEKTKGVVDEDLIMPFENYSAFLVTDDGRVEDIIDKEYGFIIGDNLDKLSDILSDETEKLNDIIYG